MHAGKSVCGVESKPMVVTEGVHLLLGQGHGPTSTESFANFAVLDDECLPYDVIIGNTHLVSARCKHMLCKRSPHPSGPRWWQYKDMAGAFCVPITSTDVQQCLTLAVMEPVVASVHSLKAREEH